MTKLYRISVSEMKGPLPSYTTSEKDASIAAAKGKIVHRTEVHWQVMEATVTFAPVESINPDGLGWLEDNYDG